MGEESQPSVSFVKGNKTNMNVNPYGHRIQFRNVTTSTL